MKRTIFFLCFNLCWLMGMAQSGELMRIYTDKDCYLAGEELWVKVNLDDEALPGNVMSTVAYVEICDSAQVRVQGKIALKKGEGWACLHLPRTMHSGVYQLTSYTRYMRNLNPDCFPRKYVAVLNTLAASDEDNLRVNDTSAFSQEVMEFDTDHELLKGDKKMYGLREKVSLQWSSLLSEAKELSLSVVRKDCEVDLPQLVTAEPVPMEGERWTAECEGHLVTGRLEGDSMSDIVSTQLACVGKEVRMFEGLKNKEGLYNFYTYGVTGRQDVVLSAWSNEGTTCRMELESPFAERLPLQTPDLFCRYEDSDLLARSVALQLMQAMPKTVFPKEMESVIYGQLPSKTYNLDEYVRFNTVRECMVEFILGAVVDKEEGREIIRLLQEERRGYSMYPALVLIDGVAFNNHTEVLDYNAHQVQYVHQYRGEYTFGERIYGGILSLVTHRGSMPDMRIDSGMQMVSYEFPQDHPAFDMPDYSNEEVRTSRRPDFRHTMYWNPSVEGKGGIEFYTSDLEGIYVATLEGITEDGKRVDVKWEFEVR